MARLPTSLSIAMWLIGSTWAVAILVHFLDGPHEFVYAALALGVVAGMIEWLALRGSNQ